MPDEIKKPEEKKANGPVLPPTDKPGTGVGTVAAVETKETTGTAEDSQGKYDQVRDKMGEILRSYGNLESEIPLNHEYWKLRNEMGTLRSDVESQKRARVLEK